MIKLSDILLDEAIVGTQDRYIIVQINKLLNEITKYIQSQKDSPQVVSDEDFMLSSIVSRYGLKLNDRKQLHHLNYSSLERLLKELEEFYKHIKGEPNDFNLFKEAVYVQKPRQEPKFKQEKGIEGYLTYHEKDPETGSDVTYLEPEPEILKIAKFVARSIKELKYYAALPNTDNNKDIKSEAASIITSLRNAEQKLRDLNRKLIGIKKIGGK